MKIYLIKGGYYDKVCCKNFEALTNLCKRSILKVADCKLSEFVEFCEVLETAFSIENDHTVKLNDYLPCHNAELQSASVLEFETIR